MRIAGVGFSCIDIYENINRFYPTGNSVDFVIHMSRLGYETSMITGVGDDRYGALMADVLCKEGVDISHLHVKKGNTAVFKMDLNGNDRVHKEKIEGVMKHFSLNDKDISFIREHDYVHTNFSGRVTDSLPELKRHGLRTIFDFSVKVDENASLSLPYIDYAFFSYTEDNEYIRDYMKWAIGFGPKVVVVTLGENGSLAFDGTTFYKEGIWPATVVNTVGAGDSFCAGFTQGIIENYSIQDCLKNGAKVAAEVVSKFEPY